MLVWRYFWLVKLLKQLSDLVIKFKREWPLPGVEIVLIGLIF